MEQDINLDELNENDILQALEGIPIDGTSIDNNIVANKQPNNKQVNDDNGLVKLAQSSSNSGDIIQLLKQLLDDKTLEISIKIKD